MAEDELKPLPPRQMRFVEEYVKDLNGAAAAIRAGYSSHTARSIASEYLARPDIAEHVERAKATRLSRTHYEADSVLQEMATLAHSDVSHYALDDDGQVILAPGAPPDAMKAIKKIKRKIKRFDARDGKPGWTEVDVEIELWDKPGPLKLMGRHVGIFPDRVEVTGKDGAPLSSLSDQELAERAAKIAAIARGMAEDK
jgi:phage terminase small subunit